MAPTESWAPQKPDRIKARGGNDRVKGRAGGDRLKGSKGKDRLKGGPWQGSALGWQRAADRLNAFDDRKDRRVNGGPGNDVCTIDQADLPRLKKCEKAKVRGRRARRRPGRRRTAGNERQRPYLWQLASDLPVPDRGRPRRFSCRHGDRRRRGEPRCGRWGGGHRRELVGGRAVRLHVGRLSPGDYRLQVRTRADHLHRLSNSQRVTDDGAPFGARRFIPLVRPQAAAGVPGARDGGVATSPFAYMVSMKTSRVSAEGSQPISAFSFSFETSQG